MFETILQIVVRYGFNLQVPAIRQNTGSVVKHFQLDVFGDHVQGIDGGVLLVCWHCGVELAQETQEEQRTPVIL